MTKIKICGLRRPEDIQAVNQYFPDYAGFVFAPGKRQITPGQAEKLSRMLNPNICPVGVFVNESEDIICRLADSGVIRAISSMGRRQKNRSTG